MTEYHSNLSIDDGTTIDELVDYTKRQARSPYTHEDTTVYNFSTHAVDEEALEHAIEEKLNRNLYQIPMQVLTAQAFIQSILPQRIREAEILLYRQNESDYYGYDNFIRNAPSEYQEKVQQDIADIIRKQ